MVLVKGDSSRREEFGAIVLRAGIVTARRCRLRDVARVEVGGMGYEFDDAP